MTPPMNEPTTPANGHPDSQTARPTTAEEWEQVRRSVAMLPPGAWAMRREQALHSLAALLAMLRSTPRR